MVQVPNFLTGLVSRTYPRPKDNSAKELASRVSPICRQMLAQLNYVGAPQPKSGDVEALLSHMYERAAQIGVALDTPISAKAFRLGYAEGLLAHPNHPVEIQGYVGLFTWLAVQYDDIVGRDSQIMEEALLFHRRFFRGESQPNKLLEGIADLIREAHDHFDPVLANLLQISVLKFLTSNLLERHDGFQNMAVSQAGKRFPDFYRDLSGMSVAYAVFCYPKVLYPDVAAFLEAIPDMAKFIDIANDVLSFYKEVLEGETRTYIHNLAACTGKRTIFVLEEVKRETLECSRRIDTILEGKGKYAQSWSNSVRGYMAMHTTNPRYKLKDLGLGEDHPLEPFEQMARQLFERFVKANK